MINKLVWYSGQVRWNWLGRAKALVMTQVDINTGELGEVVDVPMPVALKHVFDELDSLRNQNVGMHREIHDLLREKRHITDTANELVKDNDKLRKQVEFMRLPATSQQAVMGAAMSTAQLSAVEMIRSLEEARSQCAQREDLFSKEFRSILDSVAERATGGYVQLKSTGIFGEHASETLMPRPPASVFPLKGGTAEVVIGSNLDGSALSERVNEAIASANKQVPGK